MRIHRCAFPHLIVVKGRAVHELEKQCNVKIFFPKGNNRADLVKIRGRRKNVQIAKTLLLSRADFHMQVEDLRFEISGMRAQSLWPLGFDGSLMDPYDP